MESSFSFFRAPILNLYPEADWTLADAWRYKSRYHYDQCRH